MKTASFQKPKSAIRQQLTDAIHACQEKKAEDISVLQLEKSSGAFTDYFVVCSGSNPRQIQAISDEVEQRLENAGMRANNIEGYKQAEWILLDYVDFVVHIFSPTARKYYDLERLWKSARQLSPGDLSATPDRGKPARAAASVKRGTGKRPQRRRRS